MRFVLLCEREEEAGQKFGLKKESAAVERAACGGIGPRRNGGVRRAGAGQWLNVKIGFRKK
uniref:Uncharacterized protein n=1 Tax=Cucumis melo TaxID=3656 RepID=A0A9I9DAG2_CUCME